MLISYFCGFDAECGDPESVTALQRAKTVVETQYSVVGVVEERNLSLALMEAYLPRWFQGVFNHLNFEAFVFYKVSVFNSINFCSVIIIITIKLIGNYSV